MSENGQTAGGLLNQLDALRAAATADLPWRVGEHFGIHVYGGPDEQTPVGTCHREADAALTVAAVNAVPRLVAALRVAWEYGGHFSNIELRRLIAAALTDGTPR